jgi:NAD-dependent DNA ligase
VDKLIAAGYDDVCKIIRITKEDLLKLDGFKEKRAAKIHTAIGAALEKASPILIMKASNVFGRGFGERRLEPIFEKYPDILVSKDSDSEKIKKVATVPGIATLTASAFVEKIPQFMAFIKKCGLEDRFIKSGKQSKTGKEESKQKAVTIVQEKKGDPSHPLYGKNIMFTGFRPKELMASLKDLGAKIGSSVSKNTFVLVVKDPDEDSGKVSKAKELGVPVMVVDKFREKYMK